MDDIFIVGTDTDVGKSVVSLLVMQFLYHKGYSPFYVKPFQTGCKDPYDTDSDAAFVYRHIEELRDKDPAESVVYCHPNPKAPYFAARDVGERIDLTVVEQGIAQKRGEYSPLVIEAAGGLLVPVTKDLMVVDLVKLFKCKPLLVARAGLGTINHTLLSIEVLRHRGIEPFGIVFVDSYGNHEGQNLVEENMEAIKMLSGLNVSGVIEPIVDFNMPGRSNLQAIEKVLS